MFPRVCTIGFRSIVEEHYNETESLLLSLELMSSAIASWCQQLKKLFIQKNVKILLAMCYNKSLLVTNKQKKIF